MSSDRHTSLYARFLLEREEILRHKWIQSEQQGRDIGFDAALIEWVTLHRKDWIKNLETQADETPAT